MDGACENVMIAAVSLQTVLSSSGNHRTSCPYTSHPSLTIEFGAGHPRVEKIRDER